MLPPWLGAGAYLAKQLVHLHGLYLRAAGGAKNRGVSLGQGGHPLLRFLGNAWLWHMSVSAAAGQASRGTAPSRCPHSPPPAWACRTTLCPPAVFPGWGGCGVTIQYVGSEREGCCPAETGALTLRPAPLGLCDPDILTPLESWPISVSTGLSRAFVLSYSRQPSGRSPVWQDGN